MLSASDKVEGGQHRAKRQNDFSLRNIWSPSRTETVSLNEGCRFSSKHLLGWDRCVSPGRRVLTDGERGRMQKWYLLPTWMLLHLWQYNDDTSDDCVWKQFSNVNQNTCHTHEATAPKFGLNVYLLRHQQQHSTAHVKIQGRGSMSSALLWNYTLLPEQQD